MKLKQGYKAIIITIICFGLYLIAKDYFATIKTSLDQITHIGLLSYILTYAILSIPILMGTFLISPKLNIFDSLGLFHNPFRSFVIALIFALPMLLGGLFFFQFNTEVSISTIIGKTLIIGLVEELFFRGFLFGQIYKHTRLGFISAIIIGALIFASGHLYQSQDSTELVGIFFVTFMGAVLFAWLYVEWNYNLWVPIFLHALMNLAWLIFDMDGTALGGMLPNIFRGLTIALAIILTIIYKKRQQQKLAITREKLIVKPV